MKRLLLTLGATIAAAMTVFGYSNDDQDVKGHAFSDTKYYVQATKDDPSFWGSQSLFDGSGDSNIWSDGLAPHAKSTTSPNDYYMPSWRTIRLTAHWGYAHSTDSFYLNPETGETFQNRVALGSLTVGPYANLFILMNQDPIDYAYTFNDLRLRPRGVIQMNTDDGITGFCFKGKITILSEDEDLPSLFMLAQSDQPLYLKSALVGTENAQMLISGETGWDAGAELTGNIGNAFIQGDNSKYYGVIGVGANVTVSFGSDVNGIDQTSGAYALVKVDGRYCDRQGTGQGANTEHTAIGLSRVDKKPVTLAGLEMADDTAIIAAGIFTNGTGFVCSTYYKQDGYVVIDCAGCDFDAANYNILTVPTGDNCVGFSLDAFEVINLDAEGYETRIVDNGNGTQTFQIYNPDVVTTDYVELIKDDAHFESKESIAADYAMYTGASYWEDNMVPSPEDGPNHDYLIPSGFQLTMPIAWAIAQSGETSAKRPDHLGKFYAKSLTIARGAGLALGSLANEVTSASYYSFETDNLILMPGGQIHQDLNEWQNGDTYMRNGIITIKGTESLPSLLWLSNNRTNAGQQWSLNCKMGLAGEGVLRIAGGGENGKENNGYYGARDPHTPNHMLTMRGDNSAFTGTIKVGAYESALVAYSPLWGNVELLLGASGLPNASLVFDDGEPCLGVGDGKGSYVPVKNLSFVDGNTIDAGTMISDNGGYGFKVTGTFEQEGTVIVDVASVPVTMKRVRILSVPQDGGTLDASNFVVINNPTEDCSFEVETASNGDQVLTLINPNASQKGVTILLK